MSALTRLPPRILVSERDGGRLPLNAALGELAFASPQVFGGFARKRGLSCQTCHTNGHVNTDFFVSGLARRPGNFDVTNGVFNPDADDHILNDVNIPSLRGVASTAPYGWDGRTASLREFTREVIVNEFGGEDPAPWLLDALVAYQRQLSVLPTGRRAVDDPAQRRGAALFVRPFPGRPDLSCSVCHPADALFTDRRSHDVGTGGVYDTPSLLNASSSAPYLHDGSAADLAAVIAHFDRQFDLRLSAAERADLLAYVEGIAGSEGEAVRPSLTGDLSLLQSQLDLLSDAIERNAGDRVDFVVRALRHRLGDIAMRLPGDALAAQRAILVAWSRGLALLSRQFDSGDDAAARLGLAALRADMTARRPQMEAVSNLSLYDPQQIGDRLANRGRGD